MTPEEIQEVTSLVLNAVKDAEGSNGPVYLLISIIVAIGPFAMRYFKKAFVKSMSDAVQKIVNATLEGHTEKVSNLEKKVDDNHESLLDKLKHSCSPVDTAEG